jgi:hypothetical protein
MSLGLTPYNCSVIFPLATVPSRLKIRHTVLRSLLILAESQLNLGIS